MMMNKKKELLRKPETPLKTLKPAIKPAEGQPPAPRALLQRGAGNAAIQRAVIRRKAAKVSTPPKASGIPVSQPGDHTEREAEQTANKVLHAPGGLSISSAPPAAPSRPSDLPDTVQSALASGGRPLDSAARAFFEPRFGADLSRVRLHTGPAADRSVRDLEAKAYTVGADVVFRQGHDLSSRAGKELLAHELAHVVRPGEGLQRAPDARPAGHTEKTPAEFVEGYKGALGIKIEEISTRLFEIAWMSPDHYQFVIDVIDKVPDSDQDDVAERFCQLSRDDNLDEFASTETGRKMLKRMAKVMSEGFTSAGEMAQITRCQLAVAHAESAQKGREEGMKILNAAATNQPAAAAPQTGVKVLPLPELSNRLQLLSINLERVAKRYEKDPAVTKAITAARANLSSSQTNLSVDTAPTLSRLLADSQLILERTEYILLNLDLQISGYDKLKGEGPASQAKIDLTQNVRDRYLTALGLLLQEGAVPAFNTAEAVAAQLPRAITEVELAQLEGRPPTHLVLEPSRKAIVEWVGKVRVQIDALQTDATALAKAREEGAKDLPQKIAEFEKKRELIQLSLEAIEAWERSLRAHEYLAGEGSIIRGGYADTSTIRQRCFNMQKAAYANNLDELRSLVKAHREDKNVEEFYKKLPAIVVASRLTVSLGITVVAAMATAGVGGAFAGAIGTTTTTTGRVLALAGTAAVEAITFTTVSRGLQKLAPGPGPQGSVLLDLAWNFGLFALMRGLSVGIQAAAEAQSMKALAQPVNAVASFGLLQGYGAIRFRLEQNRWPTGDELAQMTAENLLMTLGIALATRSVNKLIEANKKASNLQTFQKKYAWRFEALEQSRQSLMGKFRTALASDKAADPATIKELTDAGQKIEEAFRDLIKDINNDSSFSLEGARKELASLGIDKLEGSQELLSKALGLPEDVRLRYGGTPNFYTYEWGGTGRIENGLRATGAKVTKSANEKTGQRIITADMPDGSTITFLERVSPFPATAEVDVDPSNPALLKLLSDFTIHDPAAQRFLVRLLSIEYAKNPEHSLDSAAKPVRTLLRRLEAQGKKNGRSTEQELLDLRTKGVITEKADPALVAKAKGLESLGILSSPEWLSARTPQEFESAVSEWIGYEELAAATPAGRSVLRQVHIIGDLFEDSALTRPRLEPSSGKPRTGVDVVPELDLLSVSQTGGQYDFHHLGNLKGFTDTSGAADAARQNQLALSALRAHASGSAVEVTTREGAKVYAKVTKVTAFDPASRAAIDLTGKIKETSGGATSETIGPKQKKSPYGRQLSVSAKDIGTIAKVLREKESMASPDY